MIPAFRLVAQWAFPVFVAHAGIGEGVAATMQASRQCLAHVTVRTRPTIVTPLESIIFTLTLVDMSSCNLLT